MSRLYRSVSMPVFGVQTVFFIALSIDLPKDIAVNPTGESLGDG
jgi:hypothetical protein